MTYPPLHRIRAGFHDNLLPAGLPQSVRVNLCDHHVEAGRFVRTLTDLQSVSVLNVDTLVNTAGPATITAAQLINAYYTRDCNGADRTDTTDTAALIIAAFGGTAPQTGQRFSFIVKNTGSANNLTVAGGSGVTVTGQAVIGPSMTMSFSCFVASATTVTMLANDLKAV